MEDGEVLAEFGTVPGLVGAMIGKGGAGVRALRDTSGARVIKVRVRVRVSCRCIGVIVPPSMDCFGCIWHALDRCTHIHTRTHIRTNIHAYMHTHACIYRHTVA